MPTGVLSQGRVSQSQYVDMSVLGSVLNSVVHLYKMTIK